MVKGKLTIEELRSQLAELADGGGDPESDHQNADRLLLKYIKEKRVSYYFHKIKKWYA